ncbi:MAG: molybdenum cofactor biosynthesis protein MoaE [Actinobacteria bacterium]|jgi:molybdopterin synthase catalytic subunit|nr:molybdenum cofactor biosynthesis protein MoaE [Actinomycetota bacterium]
MSSDLADESSMLCHPDGDRWVALRSGPLPIEEAMRWAIDPACGAIVSFSGTVRNFSDNRPDVSILEYEAYEEYVEPKFLEIIDNLKKLWHQVHKVAILHRIGKMNVTESSVFIVVSAEHRESAFQAAKFCIDTVKTSVPIWKKELWSTGSDWGSDPQDIVSIEEL